MVMQILLPILVICLGAFFFGPKGDKDKKGDGHITMSDLQLLIPLMLAATIFFVLYGQLADSFGPDFAEPVFQEEQELASLRSHDATTGSFGFLGVGSIEDELFYSYYRLDQGAYRPEKVSGDKNDIWVHEEDRTSGRVEVYDLTFTKWWHWILFNPPDGDAYHFYIPEGSIQRDFVLE